MTRDTWGNYHRPMTTTQEPTMATIPALHPVSITYDPWNPDADPVVHVLHVCADCGHLGCIPSCEARRDRAANRPCPCRRSDCGECMREAHQGNRPPTVTP